MLCFYTSLTLTVFLFRVTYIFRVFVFVREASKVPAASFKISLMKSARFERERERERERENARLHI